MPQNIVQLDFFQYMVSRYLSIAKCKTYLML